jgi:hypothetical protein
MLHPLSDSNYLSGLHSLLLCELESADLVSFGKHVWAVGTDTQCFCVPSFVKKRRKYTVLEKNLR